MRVSWLKGSGRRRLRRLIALIGGVGLLVAFWGPPLAASPSVRPTITPTVSTFNVPKGSTSTWTLRLWSHGTLQGSATGTSGQLTVTVPHTSDCAFQADVTVTVSDGRPYFYSGTRATLPHCGVVQTIAGHIYLCTSAGGQTTTEVSGGTLSATGPQTVTSQANPLTPTEVASGGYTMAAGTPTGFLLVACGGSATVATGGLTATQSVTVPAGGAGVGIFYVTAADLSPGTSPAGSGPTAVVSTSPAAGPPAAIAAGDSSPPRPVAAASSHLAFTGMDTGPPLLLGLMLLALGTLLTAISGRRRSALRLTIPVDRPVPTSYADDSERSSPD